MNNEKNIPEGITLWKIHREKRISEIMMGCMRYWASGENIPRGWWSELKKLCKEAERYWNLDYGFYNEKENIEALKKETTTAGSEYNWISKRIGITITKDENGYTVDCPYFDIYCHGKDPKEALKEFCSVFDYFSDHYKKISYSKITGLAVYLKKRFLNLWRKPQKWK